MASEFPIVGGPFDGMIIPWDSNLTSLTAEEHIKANLDAQGYYSDEYNFDGEKVVWADGKQG